MARTAERVGQRLRNAHSLTPRIKFVNFDVNMFGFKTENGTIVEVDSIPKPNKNVDRYGVLGILQVFRNQQSNPVESLLTPSYYNPYNPVESNNPLKKCWTTFSYLQPISRTFKLKLLNMEIQLYPKDKWMPQQLFKPIEIMIHSPNTLPDVSNKNYKILQGDKHYEIWYNQVHTELLGYGYDKNCYNYDLDKYANFNMRSDCILDFFSMRRTAT